MADLHIPRVRAADAIADQNGRATSPFVQFWDKACRAIEGALKGLADALAANQAIVAQQAAQLVLINQALELAGLALETADGGSANKSGSATSIFPLSGTTSYGGPLVALTGVVAGDLTVPGTGPSMVYGTTAMTGGTYVEAEYDIVEVVGGDTVLFTGSFNVTDVTGDEPSQVFQVVHTSAPDIAALSLARTSTGAVSYRIDIRRLSGATMTGMRFYLFTRRAA